MPARGPFALVLEMAAMLDDLGVPYALGGSMASSLVGEPRSTVDVDLAVQLDAATGEVLLERVSAAFYAPVDAARDAIRAHSSFNLVDTKDALKVDLFVVGDGLLDRMQIQRRVRRVVPGAPQGIWVTSPEDQVLRKLDWFRQSGSTSDRQWRDVVSILRIQGPALDSEYLVETAGALDLSADLDEARRQAGQ